MFSLKKMSIAPTDHQKQVRKRVAAYVAREVMPFADHWSKAEAIPAEALKKLASEGYLGATIPVKYGGLEMDQVSYGIINEEVGKGCSSLRSLITVHSSLVSETILRWGTDAQKQYWLPLLAKGIRLAAFCLSEPETGSDAKNITTSYEDKKDHAVINGVKKWTTFGQVADVYLVIAKNPEGESAFLVERNTTGIEVKPLNGMLGTQASMLAEIHFTECKVPMENLLGRKGMGFMQVVNTALDNGRYSVACGSVGIARACLEESIAFSKTRKQFGVLLKEHQLTKQKIANMITNVKAAQLLCFNAGYLRDAKSPDAFIQTSVAKYFASRAANRIASDAVQLHGALGCHDALPIQRYFRDAKIMEIIEGSTEIQQLLIADYGISNLRSIIGD